MHARVARKSFECLGVFEELLRLRLGRDRAFQFRIFFRRRVEGYAQFVGNHPSDSIRRRVGKPHHAADVAHHAFRFELAERNDLRDAAFTVLLPHVFENFAAARFTKIDIDVRRRNSVRIQEPLEYQAVLQRIDVGDSENVRDHRPGSRTAPGPDWNAFLLRKMNEVPNDQQIADETGFLEDAQLIIDSPDQLSIVGSAVAIPLAQALVTKLAQIFFPRFAGRSGVLRISRAAEFNVEVATLANVKRIINGLGKVAEQLAHFRWRFEIQLGHITHPSFVLHHFTRADAKHYIVRVVIAAPEKMHIVGRDQADAEVSGNLRQHLIALALLLNSVVVQFDEKIVRSENVPIIGGTLSCLLDVVRLYRGIDFAGETAAQPNQTG